MPDSKLCEALKKSPAFFDRTVKLFDCLSAGVVVADHKGEHLYWNSAAKYVHGYGVAQDLRKPLAQFFRHIRLSRDEQTLCLDMWPMSRLLRGETVSSEELRVERLDTGQCWYISYDGAVLESEDSQAENLFVLTLRDVSAEREAQSQLRQAAELFRAVAESTEDALFVKDRAGKYLYFNPAAARFTGKSSSEVVGRDDTFLFAAEDARTIRDHDLGVMETGQASVWEEVLTSDGVRRTYQASKSPYRDPDGKVVGLVGISRDISERKRVELELMAERERLKRLANVTPGALHTYHVRADGSHHFSDTTPALERVYGVPKELLQRDADYAFRRIHPEDLPKIFRSIAAAAERMEQWNCEFRVLHPELGETWIDGRSCPVSDGEGGLFWHGILIDITAQKETTAALQAQKDRFQDIVDSVPGAIYSFRMRPDGSGYFPYASPAMEAIFGIPTGKLSENAAPVFEMVLPDYLNELLIGIESSRDRLEPWSSQIPFQHPQRGLCWAQGQSVPTRLPDGSTLWHGYLWDSTDQRSLEQQFWQAQKMEAVGRLAGGVAHDFNNLLTVINGYADLSLQETDQEDPLYPGLVQIREAGERSARLTQQLLAFSKQGPIEPNVFDANAQILGSQKMLRRLLGEDVEYQLQLTPGVLPLYLDQGQFEQLVLNLVVNARDAMPSGGKLTLTTDNYQGEFLMTVRDSGCGISAEILSRIFDPFFTTKEIGKGTGLGLAVVHGVLTRGGGRAEVESEPGAGTLFRIFFPLATMDSEQPALSNQTSVGTETVLVVEDEGAVRRVLVEGLRKCGYRVLMAEDGLRAVELASQTQETIHLLLSDVVMPGMCGPEAAQRILETRPKLKILFMTGYTEDARIPVGILRKPFTPQEAARKIRALLDGS